MKITTIGIDLAKEISSSRRESTRKNHAPQAAAPKQDGEILHQLRILSDWHGSLW